MLKKLFLIGLFIVGAVVAGETGADALYAHEEWSAALTAYEKEEAPTPGMLVRMGDCAIKNKNYAMGLGYWHKAARGLYFLSYYDIAMRIFVCEAEAGIHGAVASPSWYVGASCAAIPPVFWQVCLLLLLLLGAWRVRGWWQKRSQVILWILGVGILVFAALAWWSMQYRSAVSAVVLQTTSVRTGPDGRFTELGRIAACSPVHITDQAAFPGGLPWCKISTVDRCGWVPQSSLLLV